MQLANVGRALAAVQRERDDRRAVAVSAGATADHDTHNYQDGDLRARKAALEAVEARLVADPFAQMARERRRSGGGTGAGRHVMTIAGYPLLIPPDQVQRRKRRKCAVGG